MKRRIVSSIIITVSLCLSACAPQVTPTTPATNPPPVQPTITALATKTLPTPVSSSTPTAPAATATQVPAPVTIPDPAGYTWKLVVDGIARPTDIQSAPGNPGRLFIVEQTGRILLMTNDVLASQPFLDISNEIGSDGSEQGLLGLAFHPGYQQNGYFFVNYTDRDGNTHISRFTASGDSVDPQTEKKLLFIQQPFPNHNGGALAFGPDGYLYIGLGDGGSAGDPYGNAQSGNSLLGKILRIDVNNGEPYAIPADNPFATSGEVYKEIWASGLRNPWRFSFDRKTGDFWIGDVGQNQWEEIDFIKAGTPGGLNFGWNKMEANHPYKGSNQPEYTPPVVEYPHGPGCSVSGGQVYRGEALPEWQGVYFFGDYCSGEIWGLASPPEVNQAVTLFQTGFKISTFGLDQAGELYVADYSGAIYRLERKP